MPICPMCEHQQDQGLECQVCGKDLRDAAGLGGRPPPPVAVQVLEGLETTIPQSVGEVPVAAMPELQASRYDAGEVQVARIPDVEPTRQAPSPDAPVQRMGELSEDRAAPVGAPTPVSQGPATCRYCRNVQAVGTLCDRCGMKLPLFTAAAAEEPGGKARDERITVRCKACGAPATAGHRCTQCGRDTPWPKE